MSRLDRSELLIEGGKEVLPILPKNSHLVRLIWMPERGPTPLTDAPLEALQDDYLQEPHHQGTRSVTVSQNIHHLHQCWIPACGGLKKTAEGPGDHPAALHILK